MPDIPVMHAANALEIHATYDRLWIKEVVVSAPSVGGDAEARVFLQRYRVVGDTCEEAPEAPTVLTVPNVLSGADTDTDLADAVAALIRYVTKAATEQGVVRR